MFDLRKLTKQEQYKLLMTTVHEASVLDRGGYEPTSKLGELNLLGVRGFSNGKASSNTYQSFDDTIFLFGLTKKGDIVVEEFVASTDYGNARYSRTPEYPKLTGKPRKAQKGDALVNIGQSKYKIHYHATSRYPQRWSVANPYYKSGRHYRALRPLGDGGSHSFRDLDGDTIQDLNEIVPFMNEPSERNLTLNIHFSMPYDDGPRGFSYGCQTISGNNKENMYDWSRYQSFIKLIEEDYSIRRGGDNELAERETGRVNKEGGKDGKRWLIYTLVTGTFLAEVYEKSFGLSLPVAVDLGGEPTTNVTPQSLAALHQLSLARPDFGGFFPVGLEKTWHGGIHLYPETSVPVFAPLPGRIILARLCEGDLADGPEGSRNFVVLRHEHEAGVFYTLFHHLAPLDLKAQAERKESNGQEPLDWLREPRPTCEVVASSGVALYASAEAENEVERLGLGDTVKLLEDRKAEGELHQVEVLSGALAGAAKRGAPSRATKRHTPSSAKNMSALLPRGTLPEPDTL